MVLPVSSKLIKLLGVTSSVRAFNGRLHLDDNSLFDQALFIARKLANFNANKALSEARLSDCALSCNQKLNDYNDLTIMTACLRRCLFDDAPELAQQWTDDHSQSMNPAITIPSDGLKPYQPSSGNQSQSLSPVSNSLENFMKGGVNGGVNLTDLIPNGADAIRFPSSTPQDILKNLLPPSVQEIVGKVVNNVQVPPSVGDFLSNLGLGSLLNAPGGLPAVVATALGETGVVPPEFNDFLSKMNLTPDDVKKKIGNPADLLKSFAPQNGIVPAEVQALLKGVGLGAIANIPGGLPSLVSAASGKAKDVSSEAVNFLNTLGFDPLKPLPIPGGVDAILKAISSTSTSENKANSNANTQTPKATSDNPAPTTTSSVPPKAANYLTTLGLSDLVNIPGGLSSIIKAATSTKMPLNDSRLAAENRTEELANDEICTTFGDTDTAAAVADFLKSRGYTELPITIPGGIDGLLATLNEKSQSLPVAVKNFLNSLGLENLVDLPGGTSTLLSVLDPSKVDTVAPAGSELRSYLDSEGMSAILSNRTLCEEISLGLDNIMSGLNGNVPPLVADILKANGFEKLKDIPGGLSSLISVLNDKVPSAEVQDFLTAAGVTTSSALTPLKQVLGTDATSVSKAISNYLHSKGIASIPDSALQSVVGNILNEAGNGKTYVQVLKENIGQVQTGDLQSIGSYLENLGTVFAKEGGTLAMKELSYSVAALKNTPNVSHSVPTLANILKTLNDPTSAVNWNSLPYDPSGPLAMFDPRNPDSPLYSDGGIPNFAAWNNGATKDIPKEMTDYLSSLGVSNLHEMPGGLNSLVSLFNTSNFNTVAPVGSELRTFLESKGLTDTFKNGSLVNEMKLGVDNLVSGMNGNVPSLVADLLNANGYQKLNNIPGGLSSLVSAMNGQVPSNQVKEYLIKNGVTSLADLNELKQVMGTDSASISKALSDFASSKGTASIPQSSLQSMVSSILNNGQNAKTYEDVLNQNLAKIQAVDLNNLSSYLGNVKAIADSANTSPTMKILSDSVSILKGSMDTTKSVPALANVLKTLNDPTSSVNWNSIPYDPTGPLYKFDPRNPASPFYTNGGIPNFAGWDLKSISSNLGPLSSTVNNLITNYATPIFRSATATVNELVGMLGLRSPLVSKGSQLLAGTGAQLPAVLQPYLSSSPQKISSDVANIAANAVNNNVVPSVASVTTGLASTVSVGEHNSTSDLVSRLGGNGEGLTIDASKTYNSSLPIPDMTNLNGIIASLPDNMIGSESATQGVSNVSEAFTSSLKSEMSLPVSSSFLKRKTTKFLRASSLRQAALHV